jgi:hypothetical protein
MPHRTTTKTGSSFLVESFLVGRAVSSDMALLSTIETVSQRVFFFFAFFVRMVLRSTLVAEAALGRGTLVEKMVSGSAFQTSLLMTFLVLEFSQSLLLPAQLLLYSFTLILIYSPLLFFWINNMFLGGLERLLQLGQLRKYPLLLRFILLDLLSGLIHLQLTNPLLNLLNGQMYFLSHLINFYNIASQPIIILKPSPERSLRTLLFLIQWPVYGIPLFVILFLKSIICYDE